MGEYYRGYEGDTRSLDYGAFEVLYNLIIQGTSNQDIVSSLVIQGTSNHDIVNCLGAPPPH